MSEIHIHIKPLRPGVSPPSKATPGSAGFDLRANYDPSDGPVVIYSGEYELVPCGFAMELPAGWEAQIRPRSGLAKKYGVTVLNSPGTIDPDYRGEVGVLLINHGDEPFVVQQGERVAQMVFGKTAQAEEDIVWVLATHLTDTSRGTGGFGSTG